MEFLLVEINDPMGCDSCERERKKPSHDYHVSQYGSEFSSQSLNFIFLIFILLRCPSGILWDLIAYSCMYIQFY